MSHNTAGSVSHPFNFFMEKAFNIRMENPTLIFIMEMPLTLERKILLLSSLWKKHLTLEWKTLL